MFGNLLCFNKAAIKKGESMGKLLKIVLVLGFFFIFAGVVFILMMAQKSIVGIVVGLGLDILLIILLGIGVYGIMRGKITFLQIKSRLGAIGFFFISVMFLCYVNGLSILNLILEKEADGMKAKTLLLANLFLPVGYQGGLQTEKTEGLIVRFPEGERGTIAKLNSYYPSAKDEMDQMFGEAQLEPLAIIIYDKKQGMGNKQFFESNDGFYQSNNQSIHLLSPKLLGDDQFQSLFFHEYTHHRTHQFLKQNGISEGEIPAWFHEGISEFVRYSDTYADMVPKKIIDFRKMDKNADFKQAKQGDYDPYLQSYLAVKELVLEQGSQAIPELLLAAKEFTFYDAFQKITGKNIELFQSSLLDRRKKIDRLLKQGVEAEKVGDFKKAESVYLEIMKLDPDSNLTAGSLPNIYIKQGKFEEAIQSIKKEGNLQVWQLHLLSELYLLSNPQESVIYAEQAEQLVIKNDGGGDHVYEKFAEVIRKINSDDPVTGYEQLFKKDLLNYKEIRAELYRKLLKQFPDDKRVKNIIK